MDEQATLLGHESFTVSVPLPPETVPTCARDGATTTGAGPAGAGPAAAEP